MSDKNQLPLVSFEQAQRLKKAGFDWGTIDYYDSDKILLNDGQVLNWNCEGNDKDFIYCCAPSVALALKWVRDIVCRNCGVAFSSYHQKYYITVYTCAVPLVDSYDEAESKLLDIVLEEIERTFAN